MQFKTVKRIKRRNTLFNNAKAYVHIKKSFEFIFVIALQNVIALVFIQN